MQEAGYSYGDDGMLVNPDGEPFNLTLTAETVDSGTAYAEVLQSLWRELGVAIELEIVEPSILYPRLTERDYEAGYGRRGGWTSYDYLYAIYHSSTGRDLPGSMRSAVDDSHHRRTAGEEPRFGNRQSGAAGFDQRTLLPYCSAVLLRLDFRRRLPAIGGPESSRSGRRSGVRRTACLLAQRIHRR